MGSTFSCIGTTHAQTISYKLVTQTMDAACGVRTQWIPFLPLQPDTAEDTIDGVRTAGEILRNMKIETSTECCRFLRLGDVPVFRIPTDHQSSRIDTLDAYILPTPGFGVVEEDIG